MVLKFVGTGGRKNMYMNAKDRITQLYSAHLKIKVIADLLVDVKLGKM